MISSKNLSLVRRLVLGLCIVLAFDGVAGGKGGSKGGRYGKGGGYGRQEDDREWNSDPDEENVESPPTEPFSRSEPTAVPSQLHSSAPSITHSDAPTMTASVAPSGSPAPSTSAIPSMSPAPTMTHVPTYSAAPSVSSSPTSTARPSISSFPTVSVVPTVAVCATNDQGFFGDPTPNGIEVVFGYELEYEEGNNPVEVVSDLESSFNDFLLPLLFPDDCPSTTRRVLWLVRRLETVGVSKRPDDVPLPGVTCAEKSDEANECVVMEGALTVYTDDGTPSTTEDEIRSALQQGMEDGAFNEPPIIRVSYVDLETDPDPNKNDGGDPINTQGSGRSRGLVYGVVAGVAAFLLVGLAFLWRRKRKRDDETNLSSSMLENETLEANDATAGDTSGV